MQVNVSFGVVLTLCQQYSADVCAICNTRPNLVLQFCQVNLIRTIRNAKPIGVQHKQPGTESMEGHVG